MHVGSACPGDMTGVDCKLESPFGVGCHQYGDVLLVQWGVVVMITISRHGDAIETVVHGYNQELRPVRPGVVPVLGKSWAVEVFLVHEFGEAVIIFNGSLVDFRCVSGILGKQHTCCN